MTDKKKIEGWTLLGLLIFIVLIGAAFFCFLTKLEFHPAEASSAKNIQSGLLSMSTSDKTATLAIGSVSTSKAMLTGYISSSAATFDGALCTVEYSSPTEVLAGRFTTGQATSIFARAVEFQGSDVKAQHGYTKLHINVGSRNVALPFTVDLNKTFVYMTIAAAGSTNTYWSDAAIAPELTANDTLTLTRLNRGPGTEAMDIAYQVVELGSDARVQRGNTTWGTNNVTEDVNITASPYSLSAIDGTKSFILAYPVADVQGSQVPQVSCSAEIVNNTTIRFRRKSGTNLPKIYWQIVEFNDSTTVQNGTVLNNTSSSASVDITDVDANRSFAIVTAGSLGGSKDYDPQGALWAANLSATHLNFTRAATYNSSAAWFVAELPAVKVTAPESGTWRVGQQKSINWTHADSCANDNFTIKINPNNSTNINDYTVNITTQTGSNDTYSWTIPAYAGSQNLIGTGRRIAIKDDNATTTNFDIANGPFEIKGDIDLTYPLGGGTQNFTVGDTVQVNWTAKGDLNTNNLTLWVWNQSGSTWDTINSTISGTNNTTASYNWVINNSAPTGTSVKVKISWNADAANVTDQSDNFFKVAPGVVVTVPNATTTWYTQDNGTINWTKNGTWASDQVELYYKNVTSGEWVAVVTNANASNLTYNWTNIPIAAVSYPSKTQIRIKTVDDPSVQATNDSALFYIYPYIRMDYPNAAGVVWNVSDSPQINWTLYGPMTKAAIWYNNSSGWVLLTPGGGAGVSASSGNWTWSGIPASRVNETCQLVVAMYEGNDVAPINPQDACDNNFSIRGKLEMVRPALNQVFRVGDNEYINWSANGLTASDLVRIKFSKIGDLDAGTVLTSDQWATNQSWLWNNIPDNISAVCKVRVEHQTIGSVKADSDNFSIKGKLQLNAPDGGQIYNISENMTINWTATGTIGDVIINYTNTGGEPYNYAIQNSTGGYYFNPSGTYYWDPIPSSAQVSENIRLKVSRVLDSAVNDTSNSTLSIRGKLTLDAPNGGEVWRVGEQRYINWTRFGDSMGNIRIDYTKDNNTTDNYGNVICGSFSSAPPSQYQWNVPNVMAGAPGTRFNLTKVKIALLGAEGITYDTSNQTFYIVPNITLTRPSALTPVWYVDDNENITWTSQGDLDYVNIWYSNNSGSSWQLCSGGQQQLNDGNFTWQIPNVLGTQTRVKVTSYYDNTTPEAGGDYGNFEIRAKVDMNYPVGGEQLVVNDTCQIQWTKHGTVGTVYLQYSNDSGANWNNISGANNTSGQTYNWTVPDDIKTTCRVKVISEVYSNVFNNSTDFKIRGGINVTQPANNSNVKAHSTDTPIRWTNIGSLTGNVTIDYYNGSAWNPIQDNVTVSSNGTYLWPQVPDITVSGNAKVKVTSKVDANTTHTSDPFNIIGNITMSAPTGAAIWKPGTSNNVIQWLSYAINQIHIKWSNDSGSSWNNISTYETAANQTYSWAIPSTLAVANNFLVKVEDVSNVNASNTSSLFQMAANFNLTSPEDGYVVRAGTNEVVTWNNTSSVGVANVILEYSTAGTGGPWINLINESNPNEATANDGTHTWLNVNGTVLGSNNYVKVRDPNNANGSNMSNSSFRIRGIINVTNPQGGQSKQINEYYLVNWTKVGNVSTVKIEYSPNNGTSWTVLSGIENASNLTYNWTIDPNTTVTNNQGKIRVTDNDDSGCNNLSAGFFSVTGSFTLLQPNATGIVLNYTGANTYQITWDVFGGVPNATLKYSTTGTAPANHTNTITTVAAVNESYNWTVPDRIGSDLSIMVQDADNPAVNDTSNNPFAIKGNISINYPNATSGNWTVNWPQYVNWTPTGNYTQNVVIEYYNGSGWNTLGTQAPGLNGALQSFTLPGNVPNDITTSAKVKVSTNESNSSINVNNESSAFRIIGTVNITAPAGVLYVNDTSKYINWTSNGTISPVDILYSVNSGTTWYDIVRNYTATAGDNNYSWTPIPDRKNESSCLVKIIHNKTGMTDINNTTAAFSILPVINVTKPTTGQNLFAGSDNATVNWTYTGTQLANVDILLYNNTSQWQFIATGSVGSAGNGSYTWPVFPEFKNTNRQIRVRDNVTQNVTNDSALFNVVGRLVLTQPNASVSWWRVGDTRSIDWSQSALGNVVHIQYANSTGGSWYNVTDNLQNASNATYSWNIPDTLAVSNNFSIKLSDSTNPAVTYSTSPEIDIVAKFNISAPENGDVVRAGTNYDVTWNNTSSVGVANLILEYSTAGASGPWTNLINESNATATTANDGNYTWLNVNGTVLGSNAYVKARDPNNANGSNMSNSSFRIRGIINVTSPSDAMSRAVNQSYYVNWTRVGAISTVKIEYSHDGGNTWMTINGSVSAASGTYNWSLDPNTTNVTNNLGKIRITDNDDAGCNNLSSGNFTITGAFDLLTPTASGIVLDYTGASTYNITWNVYGGIPTAQLRYSTTGINGTYGNIITNVTASNKTYAWTIPNAIGYNLSVMVQDKDNPAVNDSSANPFAIKGNISVNYPNATSGNWTVNWPQYVNWTPTGNYTQNVVIEYYNGSGWNTLGTVSPGGTGILQSFALPTNVPNDITTTAKVKVRTQEGNASVDVSNESNTFRIKGTIDVAVPNTAVTLFVNDTAKYINWTSNGTVTPVDILYSVNNGGTWYDVIRNLTAAAGDNNYSWSPIPDRKNESSCLVKIIHNKTGMNDVNDTSNVAFTILPVINVTKPTAGQNVYAGSTNATINWTYTGTQLANVDIYFVNDTGGWQLLPGGGGVSIGSGGNGSFTWNPAPSYKKTNTQVRVWDNVTNNVSNISGLFDIVGNLRVTAPDGGQNWPVGTQQFITWWRDAISLVNIYFSTDGGSSWNTIATNYNTTGTTQYQWNISNDTKVSNSFTVKVEDVANPNATNDTSNASSAIMSVFDITSPENTTDYVIAGDAYNITWTSKPTGVNASSNVILRYSTNGGSSWSDIPGANVTPNDGCFTWSSINGTILGNQTKIQIIQSDNYNASNQSQNNFELRGNLTITYPNDTAVGAIGSALPINWTTVGNVTKVKLEYSYDAGSSWKTLVNNLNVTGSPQNWTWNINASENTTVIGKIKITDENNANTYNISSGNFDIIGSLSISVPNGGEALTYNGTSKAYINWTKQGTMENVTLYYSTNNGSSWNTVTNVTASDLTYNWTIPNEIGGNLKVKLADQDNPSVNDTSNGTFGIKGSILVTYPNGGEDWTVNRADYVNWTPTGTYPTNVIIEYYNGSAWNTLGNAPAGNTTAPQLFTLPANAPDSITTAAKVRVSANETNASINVNDESNSTFRIRGTVNVTVPNSAVTWYVNETKTIQWTSNGTVTPVLIQYSTNGSGGPWYNINGSYNAASGANTYNWTVEDLKNDSTCFIKVTHNVSGLTDINDSSDAAFTIIPKINVTEPQNNSYVAVESTTTPIRWNYTGTKISAVDIFYRQNASSSWTNIAYNVSNSLNGSYVWPSVPILRTTEAEVRVYDNATYVVNGTSNKFNIIGKLNLTSPNNASTNWIILTNTSQAVWSSTAVPTVNIYYSLNGSGGTWVYSMSANGSAGSANFTVPENCTNNASIKITDSSLENVTSDISDNNFSFVEDFQITQPEGGTVLVCGQTYDIRWTRKSASALPNVKLEFYDGNSWSLIGGNASNTGEYAGWPIPNTTISTQCKVRVVSPINQNNNNESSPPFTIIGAINVTNPNTGNESWNVEGTYPINWSFVGPITNATIQYNYNGTNPADWITLVSRTPAGSGGNGTWNWTINDTAPLSTTARIRVYDSDQNLTNDTNDFNFTVKGALELLTPSASGIVMKAGESYNITWQKFGAITQVNLSYSNNSDAGPWKPIVSNLSATPTYYNWPVADDIGSTLKVKVQDASNINVWNISSNNFTIVGKITLQRPDQAEPDWVVGESRYINWTPTGTFSSVIIQGSTNAFANESQVWNITTVPAGANGTNQSFNYSPVGDNLSNNVKIRISDANPARFSLVNDTSTDPLKIKGKLTVASPDAGTEVWVAGTKPTINWVRAGSIQNISIRVYDGSSWNTVTNVLSGTPEYNGSAYANWTVPDTAVKATKQAKVNITDAGESTVTDESNNTFLIRGALAITAPSTYGERILANTTYNITWTKTGIYSPSDNVKIEYRIGNASWQSVWSDALNAGGDSIDSGNATFPWTVPGSTLSNDVKVRMTRLADTVNVPIAESQPFAIAGNITVISPASGDKWAVNTTNPIKWTMKGNIENVSIYWNNGNGTWNFINYANGSIGNTTGHLWAIPVDNPAVISPNTTIKVSNTFDEQTNDTSDTFSIVPRFGVTAPIANQLLYANRNTYITWNKYGDVQNVNLYWSKTNFTEGLGTLIEANVTNDGNYTWPAPDDLNNTVRVRITYPADETATNLSAPFSRIVPYYEVVSPYSSAYDIWPVGTLKQVKWNCSSANASTVNIYYTVDGANYTYTIQEGANNSGAANATRIFNWTVNDTITSAFKVRIQDANSSRSDISVTSPFNSKIVGYFNLTYPNGGAGQNFTVNDNITIAWAKNGSVSNVKLEIAKNDDWINATTINGSTSNTGLYPGYLVNDLISDNVKIRVSDATDPQANDTSDNYFKVHGAINMTTPNGGDRIPIGYNTTIRWNTTGNITKVGIIAYSSLGTGDSRFPYNLSSPYNVELNYTNNGNNETTYNWTLPDNATNNLKIRVVDSSDGTIYDENSGNISVIGSFNIVSPNGNEVWVVNETRNITWFPTGSSISEARILYSSNNGTSWTAINESYNISNDGIVNNTGNLTNSWQWIVPDVISNNTLIKIEDRFDETVNDTSNATFKIRGNLSLTSPASADRWVTLENRTISWNTTGSISKVHLYYSRDNFLNNQTIILNRTNQPGVNNFLWSVPDPLTVFTLNDSSLPVPIKIRIIDANDSTVSVDSAEFNLDYYNITWYVKDFLSNLQVTTGLSINDTSGWINSGLASPVAHKTPYGSWEATWIHKDYGDATEKYIADSNKNITVYLESKVVHVWEARTDYVYDAANDKLSFKSYLTRDGSMAGARDANGTFYTIANNSTIEVYNATGALIKTLNTTNVSSAGFFAQDWASTGLNTTEAYNGITQIDTSLGGKFRTPFLINILPAASLYNASTLISQRIDVPLSVIQAEMVGELTNQTTIIQTKMNETVAVIQNTSAEMQAAVNETLTSFETRTYQAIADLQTGANQTINASVQALNASAQLEATAKKYSWSASVSPDPSLTGDLITLSCQGQPGLLPLLNIYSWENKKIVSDVFLTETTSGLYKYSFTADSRFATGKAYTFIITEQTTGGMVTGSGVVESMSISTIAGLASAAPGAERAAKKALDAINAVKAVLVSGENINIGLTLKNLKESVEAIPEAIKKETSSEQVVKTVNEIADRLRTLVGEEEGYNLEELLGEALTESPTLKEVRSKTDSINAIVDILLQLFEAKFGGADTPVISTSLAAGSVIFRMVVVNPSKVKKQKVEVKSYLPLEVKPKDIIDSGGLNIEYDQEKSLYYAYGPGIELTPQEVRVFKVEVEDIWVVPENELSVLKNQLDGVVKRSTNTPHFEQAKTSAGAVDKSLDEIRTTQSDESISRSQHIGAYRQNLEAIQHIKKEIAELEKLLRPTAGPATPEVLEKPKLKIGLPSMTTTWLIIIIIILFLGMLAAVFFFVMQAQVRSSHEVIKKAKESAFPEKKLEPPSGQTPPPGEKK